MIKPVLLDSGPLGRLAHPKPNGEIMSWLEGLLDGGVRVVVPEISDYELRRSFLLSGLSASVDALDALGAALEYLPLTTPAMHEAAALWAEARKRGVPTADKAALDGDCLLAAQARLAGGVVATENVKHLSRYVDARPWKDIS